MILLPFLAVIGVVASVHDGDTFRLTDGTRIRLAGIDANEMDGTCHVGCAPLSATASRDQLARLIEGQAVSCEPTGASYRRVVARCTFRGADLSCWQVRTGGAIRWARYDPEGLLRRCENGHDR